MEKLKYKNHYADIAQPVIIKIGTIKYVVEAQFCTTGTEGVQKKLLRFVEGKAEKDLCPMITQRPTF